VFKRLGAWGVEPVAVRAVMMGLIGCKDAIKGHSRTQYQIVLVFSTAISLKE